MTLSRCLVAASALILLGACSIQAPPSTQVATISTAGSATPSTTPATSTDPDNGRPRERLDMTGTDVQALDTPYQTCMAQNGGRAKIPGVGPSNQAQAKVDSDQADAKAQAVCLSKKPLPPWELDSSNPHAADFVHAVVQCLRNKGVKYVDEEPPQGDRMIYSFGGPQNDAASISKGMELAPACEKEVAAQGIGK